MVTPVQKRMAVEEYEFFALTHKDIIAYPRAMCFNVGMSNPELFPSEPTGEVPRPRDPHLDEEAYVEAIEKGKRRRHLNVVPGPTSQPEWRVTDAERAAAMGKEGLEAARAKLSSIDRPDSSTMIQSRQSQPIPNEGDFDELGELNPDWKSKRAQ